MCLYVVCFGAGVSLKAASLSTRIEVRFAYIPPSLDPTNSFCCVVGFTGYGCCCICYSRSAY
ncbi:hypothetical protein Hanom_Chr14g01248571 [Helianthus anomalus]